MKKLAIISIIAILLAGCANAPIDRQNQGIIGGALIGGILYTAAEL